MLAAASKQLSLLLLLLPIAIGAVVFAAYMISHTVRIVKNKIPIISISKDGITCHGPIVINMPWSEINSLKCRRFLFSKCLGICFNNPHDFLKRQGILIQFMGESNMILGYPPFVIFRYHLPGGFETLKQKIQVFAPEISVITT